MSTTRQRQRSLNAIHYGVEWLKLDSTDNRTHMWHLVRGCAATYGEKKTRQILASTVPPPDTCPRCKRYWQKVARRPMP